MLRQYSNQLVSVIEQHELSPTLFDTGEESVFEFSAFTITLTGTSLRFLFVQDPESYHRFKYKYVKYCPSMIETMLVPGSYSEPWEGEQWLSFTDVLEAFDSWLLAEVMIHLTEEITPDLWRTIDRQRSLVQVGLSGEEDQQSWSLEERQQIRLALNELKLLIQDRFQPIEGQMEAINARLDYLAGSTERVNRFDWRGLAVNAILSIAVTLSLSQEDGKALLHLFQKVLGQVIYLVR